jgi:hypothetical protein
MHQLVLGAAIPLAFAILYYLFRRCRASMWLLLLTPPAMALGAVWAVAPDIPRLLGWQSLYRKLATNPKSDIFFWHYSIDQIEATRLDAMTPTFNACFALLIALLLLAAWRELHLSERSKP